MTDLFARKALLETGWADDVRIATGDGRIASITQGSASVDGDVTAGFVIPGLPNAHSHAFQRVLAGHTEFRGPDGSDTFWSWRTRMYRLAGRIDADALRAIATQVYTEMLATGYTAVAEFHYLHREPDPGHDESGAVSDAMFEAIVAAAVASGIRLSYVPVFYERAGFEQPEPTPEQSRFVVTLDDFLSHYERAKRHEAANVTVGIGAHSLRAVSTDALGQIAAVAARDCTPMHIHVAEQKREVEQCMYDRGRRPVRWLLENFPLDESWCLVHATHMDHEEVTSLARSGAVVCLCPSTEANLGDGLFPLQPYLEEGGRIAIGSDSHVSINPFEELRWLEYGQRLTSQVRNVAATRNRQTGRSLFELAAVGGAQAIGGAGGGIREGADADLVVLDDDSPMLAGHTTRSLLDALVFSGFTLPIDRVMVAGEWRVVDGRHTDEQPAREDYARVASALELDEDTTP